MFFKILSSMFNRDLLKPEFVELFDNDGHARHNTKILTTSSTVGSALKKAEAEHLAEETEAQAQDDEAKLKKKVTKLMMGRSLLQRKKISPLTVVKDDEETGAPIGDRRVSFTATAGEAAAAKSAASAKSVIAAQSVLGAFGR